MSEVLKIQIGADVEQAVANIQKFAKTLGVEIGKTEGVLEAFERELNNVESSLKSLSGNALLNATARVQALKTAINQIKTNSLVDGMQNVGKATGQANTALVNFGRVVQDAPFGLIGIANNIDPLVASFGQLKRETGSTGGALKALAQQLAGPAGIAIGISAVTSLLVAFGPQIAEFFGSVDLAAEKAKKAAENFKSASESLAGEATKVETLVAVLRNENTARSEKLAAIKELNRISPTYFSGLELENGIVKGLDPAYKNYVQGLLAVARAKAVQSEITDLYTKRLEIENKIIQTDLVSALGKAKQANDALNKSLGSTRQLGIGPVLTQAEQSALGLNNQITEIDRQIAELANKTVPAYEKAVVEKVKVEKQDNEQLSAAGRLNTIVLRQLSEQEQAILKVVNARRKANEARDATFLVDGANGSAVANVAEQFRKIPAAIEAARAANNRFSEEFRANLAVTAQNVNTSFQLLGPLIDQTFNAMANGQSTIDAIRQGIKRLIVDLAKAAALAAILSVATGGVGGGGLSFLGAFKSLLGFRANGGPVGGGNPFIVGERGPELFVPNQSGRIINNAAMLGGGNMQIIPTLEFSYDQLRIAFNRANASAGRRF